MIPEPEPAPEEPKPEPRPEDPTPERDPFRNIAPPVAKPKRIAERPPAPQRDAPAPPQTAQQQAQRDIANVLGDLFARPQRAPGAGALTAGDKRRMRAAVLRVHNADTGVAFAENIRLELLVAFDRRAGAAAAQVIEVSPAQPRIRTDRVLESVFLRWRASILSANETINSVLASRNLPTPGTLRVSVSVNDILEWEVQ